MYRSSPARKYGPLALLAAAQLVVVLVAPSTAPSAQNAALAAGGGYAAPGAVDGTGAGVVGAPGAPGGSGGGPAGVAGGGGTTGGSAGTAGGGAAGGGAAGGAAAGGGSAGAGSGGAGAAPGAPGSPGGAGSKAVAGDTSHCVSGRQFDPAVDYYAPPCVPGKPGTPSDNPGATSMGVTQDKILVINYIPDYGAEVNAILKAQGLYYDAANAQVADTGFQNFINSKYQLYGRQVAIQTFQGTCRTVPPDQQCLNAEMNKIAKQFKPFAVFFQTTVCSACFAELARNKIVTFGGAGFSDEFRNALRPYNYDYGMSSTRMAKVFAEWWCNQMDGKPAIFAGAQNPAQDFRTQKRQLGVVSTNDPDNEATIRKVLYPALQSGCGASVKGHEYFYEQNVGTAATQSQAGTAVMNSRTNPATSVVCFCDPVAPQFSYNAATNNNYWPEVLFAANQAQDVDTAGQTYESGLACPQSSRGCAFDTALGVGTADPAVAPAQLAGVKVFTASSKATTALSPLTLDIFWSNLNMFASLVQFAGPNLTPATMAAGAPNLGTRGGGASGHGRRAFLNGELSWSQDAAIDYWNKGVRSPYNSKAGHFLQADGGRRFGEGEFPKRNQPGVPVKRG